MGYMALGISVSYVSDIGLDHIALPYSACLQGLSKILDILVIPRDGSAMLLQLYSGHGRIQVETSSDGASKCTQKFGSKACLGLSTVYTKGQNSLGSENNLRNH